MSLSALSLAFKKAYVRIFDGEATWTKRIAGTALLIGAPFLTPDMGPDTLSAERTPGLGDRQYQVLQQDAEKLGADFKKINAEFRSAYALSQQRLTEPKNSALAARADAAQKQYSRDRAQMNLDVNDFRSRLVMSQGISEVDAVNLVHKAQTATHYTLYPNREESWQREMRYLDECQNKTIGKGLSALGGPQAKNVISCQSNAADRDGGNSFMFGALGFGGAGGALGLLSIFGAAFRDGIPKHERHLREELDAREKRRKEKAEKKKDFTISVCNK